MRSKRGNFTKLGRGIFVIFLFAAAVFLTVVEAGVVSANPDGPDTKNLIATPSDPSFADDSLVLYMMFNENSGTIAQDASKYMNTGTLYNFNWSDNSGWTSGAFGSALSFDGVGEYVGVPLSSSLNITGDKITLMAWVKANGDGEVIATDSYMIRITAGNLQGRVNNGSWQVANGGAVSSGVWHLIAMQYDGVNETVFIDGQISGTPVAVSGNLIDMGTLLRIGAYWIYFNGAIDEVRISNVARSAAWIKASYHSGNDTLMSVGSVQAQAATNLPFYEPVQLAKGEKVAVHAKSTDGTSVTVDATIVGVEQG